MLLYPSLYQVNTRVWLREFSEHLGRPVAKGFEIVFALYYMTLLHWLWGQTLGKMAMGVRVVDVSGEPIGMGRAIVRTLGYLVSEATLGVGFLIAALRSDRRALHDLIAGTRVERVNRSGGG